MEDIIEFFVELLLEGAAEAARSKKVPKGIRIALMMVIMVLCLAIFGFLIYMCVETKSKLLTVIVVALAAAFILYVLRQIDKIKEEK